MNGAPLNNIVETLNIQRRRNEEEDGEKEGEEEEEVEEQVNEKDNDEEEPDLSQSISELSFSEKLVSVMGENVEELKESAQSYISESLMLKREVLIVKIINY